MSSNNLRKWFLLIVSYVFYASWDWRFAFLLFGLSVGDYFLALRIAADKAHRKRYLVLSLSMNLITLGIFKYFNFFVGNAIATAHMLGVEL